ncbi:MAG: phosphoribosylformylglycinamidine synthase subunit PurL [Planctomycetes bacterium]|nr:phosphoribosylformylglycinamidine synthase subunit PurL [Planctomycetota bacterium]
MSTVHRIEVRPRREAGDPRGAAACREAQSVGVEPAPHRIDAASVFLIAGDLGDPQVRRIADELLTDAVTEQSVVGAAEVTGDALVEVHPLPGVMDPDAEAIELAIRAMLGVDVTVRTGQRYDMHGVDAPAALAVAERCLANRVIHGLTGEPWHPESFPVGHEHEWAVREVPLRDLDDQQLAALSRDAHLFLNLSEMHAIRDHYLGLGRDPGEIELETLAQTWSEHCVHKTLKATIRYTGDLPNMGNRPGHEVHDDGSVTIHNLLRSTVAAATKELMADGIDWCLSVFVDNAGVIAFDDEHAVCFKVETHNHPSAIEPYGGAATGIGGCIRDIIGTGLAAKPIAATDVFCVAHPDHFERPPVDGDAQPLPAGCLHPRRILRQVVAGVRDYGNRMGIPTLNGAVWFDDAYVGNPLVYCGCVGVMPRDRVHGDPVPGDRIIAVGGRTGRDGIHGATFSSAELTDSHADEFSHAVQIGNAVTEKKTLDAILDAREFDLPGAGRTCLYRAITDCGAGGFSSAVGEMGEKLGAVVHLERAPLKYAGLDPTEIWISEAQERMVLAVPPENVEHLAAICARHDVELCDLGHFGTDDRGLSLNYRGTELGRLDMSFLHEGLPETVREARWTAPLAPAPAAAEPSPPHVAIGETLLGLLAHPNIASKRWIIRQYDHEVQGRSVVRPLVGRGGEGPGDAAVITPVRGSTRGLAIANGLATAWSRDPYRMTLAAIDECVRNLVCVGTDPRRVAILDNFCWPGCDAPEQLGALVRAAAACYDGALAFRTPFISGKDSLNNQFTTEDGRTIRIPPTLLISGFGIVEDIARCVTMDVSAPGNLLVIVGATTAAMGGSHCELLHGGGGELPDVDLDHGPRAAVGVHAAIARGLVQAAHDCSEGGLLVAAAEMAFAGDLGVHLDFVTLPTTGDMDIVSECFAETPGRYLLEVRRDDVDALAQHLNDVPFSIVGEVAAERRLTVAGADVDLAIDDLKHAWMGTLDW